MFTGESRRGLRPSGANVVVPAVDGGGDGGGARGGDHVSAQDTSFPPYEPVTTLSSELNKSSATNTIFNPANTSNKKHAANNSKRNPSNNKSDIQNTTITNNYHNKSNGICNGNSDIGTSNSSNNSNNKNNSSSSISIGPITTNDILNNTSGSVVIADTFKTLNMAPNTPSNGNGAAGSASNGPTSLVVMPGGAHGIEDDDVHHTLLAPTGNALSSTGLKPTSVADFYRDRNLLITGQSRYPKTGYSIHITTLIYLFSVNRYDYLYLF